MNGIQAIEFHRLLKKYKFTDQDADKFIRFVEHQNGDIATKQDIALVKNELKQDIGWIKWVLTALLVLVMGIAGGMYYLHSDTQADIREIRTDIKETQADIREIKALLKRK